MKVKELMERLKLAHPEAEIEMSGDSEGNSFRALHGAEISDDKKAVCLWPCHGMLGR